MASGSTLLVFTPSMNEPPGTNPATPDRRNYHDLLDFDPSTDEEAVFKAILPRNYSGNGITAYIHFSMSTDSTNNVVWQGAFERIGTGQQDVDLDGFADFQGSGQVAVPGTLGNVGVATITFTNGAQMDSIAVGELIRFKVRRDADDTSATDNASGDAELHAVELKET